MLKFNVLVLALFFCAVPIVAGQKNTKVTGQKKNAPTIKIDATFLKRKNVQCGYNEQSLEAIAKAIFNAYPDSPQENFELQKDIFGTSLSKALCQQAKKDLKVKIKALKDAAGNNAGGKGGQGSANIKTTTATGGTNTTSDTTKTTGGEKSIDSLSWYKSMPAKIGFVALVAAAVASAWYTDCFCLEASEADQIDEEGNDVTEYTVNQSEAVDQ